MLQRFKDVLAVLFGKIGYPRLERTDETPNALGGTCTRRHL